MLFLLPVWCATAVLTAEPMSVDALYDANRAHATKSGAAWVDGGMYKKADIHLWRRDVGDHFEFRAIGMVQAPIDQVLTVVLDQDHGQEWLEGSVECGVVEEKSFGHFIAYNRNGSPGPFVSGRDAASEFVTHMFPVEKAVRVDVELVDDPRRPVRDDTVRMKLISGFWLLRQIDATQTEVTYQLALDIGGHLPTFVVNLASRDVPAKTIVALRGQVGKDEYKAYHERVMKNLDWSAYGLPNAPAKPVAEQGPVAPGTPAGNANGVEAPSDKTRTASDTTP